MGQNGRTKRMSPPLRGAAERHDWDGDASFHVADERLLEGDRSPVGGGGPVFRACKFVRIRGKPRVMLAMTAVVTDRPCSLQELSARAPA
jgi:hypothetical protein